jgi:hypothetical protein
MTEVWDSLYDAFASIPDPCSEHTRHHSLIDIISIAICAVAQPALPRNVSDNKNAFRPLLWFG